jgi:hypothetical protein
VSSRLNMLCFSVDKKTYPARLDSAAVDKHRADCRRKAEALLREMEMSVLMVDVESMSLSRERSVVRLMQSQRKRIGVRVAGRGGRRS